MPCKALHCGVGANEQVSAIALKEGSPPKAPDERPREKLRQVLARYERLAQEAGLDLAAVYAAEIVACKAMLASIEQCDRSGDIAA